jgi:hypothetical protein
MFDFQFICKYEPK